MSPPVLTFPSHPYMSLLRHTTSATASAAIIAIATTATTKMTARLFMMVQLWSRSMATPNPTATRPNFRLLRSRSEVEFMFAQWPPCFRNKDAVTEWSTYLTVANRPWRLLCRNLTALNVKVMSYIILNTARSVLCSIPLRQSYFYSYKVHNTYIITLILGPLMATEFWTYVIIGHQESRYKATSIVERCNTNRATTARHVTMANILFPI